MRILKVDRNNIELLKNFIAELGDSNLTFRYYLNRTVSAIENHIITVLLIKNKKAIGYGHLDKEVDDIWLGLAILPNEKNKGYGNLMMINLLKYASKNNISKIKLSVDKGNLYAIHLYKKYGFQLIYVTATILYYEVELSNK
jgi:ribosomal protein S18 acetylase RimI-like enzyme